MILAYFFKEVWDKPPPLSEVKRFKPEDAVRIVRLGDLGLIDGTWSVIGRDPAWRRGEWKVPQFVRKSDLDRRAFIVQYSDNDCNQVEFVTPTNFDTNLERDAVLGSGAAEIMLTRLAE